jgi:hypothetical protein
MVAHDFLFDLTTRFVKEGIWFEMQNNEMFFTPGNVQTFFNFF